ncbi:hypothetical protein [Microcoleus sp. PH2017_28_MFU_U_A]|nr:hypothetical protein [Microcoleus sp. PH2017_28_MFU_U_A]
MPKRVFVRGVEVMDGARLGAAGLTVNLLSVALIRISQGSTSPA